MHKQLTYLTLMLIVFLSGCGPASVPQPRPTQPGTPIPGSEVLVDLGPAPELTNEVWLNSDRPLRLKDLRGKVVLLDMWTFG